MPKDEAKPNNVPDPYKNSFCEPGLDMESMETPMETGFKKEDGKEKGPITLP